MSHIDDNRRDSPQVDRQDGPDDAASDVMDTAASDFTGADLDELMDRLRMISDQLDPPPSIVTELARAAFETRNLDAELAVLTADSEFDVLELVRSVATEPRMVSFETDAVTVELQLDRQDSELTVRGLVVGGIGEIILDTGDRRTPAQLDDRGWFLVEGLPAGALRLHIQGADGANITTSWITT